MGAEAFNQGSFLSSRQHGGITPLAFSVHSQVSR
jgi:hypothetical protein